jgi:nitrite reductase/ring-hydroxylating ferredoxin subunit
MATWMRATSVDSCPPGQMLGAVLEGQELVICNVDGDFYAVEDLCSHQDLPLSDGELDGSELICVHHGARFDVCTGRALCLPALRPIRTFETELRDGEIWVQLP